jgi:hypothetical protein
MDTLEMNPKSNDVNNNNNSQNGTVTIEGDPKELASWMNTKVIIHRGIGRTIDFMAIGR